MAIVDLRLVPAIFGSPIVNRESAVRVIANQQSAAGNGRWRFDEL
jgi:hypothetical protein